MWMTLKGNESIEIVSGEHKGFKAVSGKRIRQEDIPQEIYERFTEVNPQPDEEDDQ